MNKTLLTVAAASVLLSATFTSAAPIPSNTAGISVADSSIVQVKMMKKKKKKMMRSRMNDGDMQGGMNGGMQGGGMQGQGGMNGGMQGGGMQGGGMQRQ